MDLLEQPQLAEGDQIIAIPTLVRKLPQPMRKIIGDLSNSDRTLVGLDLVSVAQTMLAWLVLPATLWLAPPEKNINWVRGFGHPPRRRISLPLHFGLAMLAYPLLIYLPTHLLLNWASTN